MKKFIAWLREPVVISRGQQLIAGAYIAYVNVWVLLYVAGWLLS